MNMRAVLTFAMTLTLVVPLAAPGFATAGEPTEHLRQRIDTVVKILGDRDLAAPSRAAERRAAVQKVALEIFDFEETAKRALGRHWRERSPAEQQEFVKLFSGLLEDAYLGKIEGYQGEKVTYAGDTIEGDQAVVKTRIVTAKGGSEIPVDYRMVRQPSGWRVYDVMIEGVSLISNYRTQFNKVIQTESYDALVKRLRAKAFAAPAATPAAGTR